MQRSRRFFATLLFAISMSTMTMGSVASAQIIGNPIGKIVYIAYLYLACIVSDDGAGGQDCGGGTCLPTLVCKQTNAQGALNGNGTNCNCQ